MKCSFQIVMITVLGLLADGVLFAGPIGDFPPAEAFYQTLIHWTETDQLLLMKRVARPITETYTQNVEREVTAIVDGKTVVKKVLAPMQSTRTKVIYELMIHQLDPQATRCFEVDGRPVKIASLKNRLQQPTLVLVSADGKIHPSFAAIFKPGTLVIAGPVPDPYSAPLEAPPAAAPSPVPAPQPAPSAPAPRAPVPPSAPEPNGQPVPKKNTRALRDSDITRQVSFRRQPDSGGNSNSSKFELPRAPAPLFRYLKLDGNETAAIRQFREVQVATTVYRITTVNGVKQKQPLEIRKTVREDETLFWKRALVKFLDHKGRPLVNQKPPSVDQREAVVVMSSDGQPVDLFWLQNVNANVLVVLTPTLTTPLPEPPAAPAPVPVPAPVQAP